MLAIVLRLSSKAKDFFDFAKLQKEKYKIFIVCDSNESIPCDTQDNISYHTVEENSVVTAYNKIIESTYEHFDFLFLTDSITYLHEKFFENMFDVLNAAEKHAIVCGRAVDNSHVSIETIKKYLPSYSNLLRPKSDCMLVKKGLFGNFGFLNDSYDKFFDAFTDFYMRINNFGFSVVVANYAFYKSEHSVMDSENETRLKQVFHIGKESLYDKYEAAACEIFLDLIVGEAHKKKKVLFCFANVLAHHTGTSEFSLSLYESFYKLYKDKYDIHVFISREADLYHKVSDKYDNIIYPDTISGTFDLCFVTSQLQFIEQQLMLNRHCLKIVQTMFDIIMLRCNEHPYFNGNLKTSFRLSDGMVFISNFGANDFGAYFHGNIHAKNIPHKTVYLSSDIPVLCSSTHELPFTSYFLIIGNKFKHKAIKETIDAVSKTKFNYIIVGYGDGSFIEENIYGYQSGHLDTDFLNFLYVNCTAVIFPSQYEGFGLPIAIGLKNKKRVIVSNVELNRELQEYFRAFENYFLFFDNFSQIPEIINRIDFSEELPSAEYTVTWDNAAVEIEVFFEEILNTEVNVDKLNERWYLFNFIEEKTLELKQLHRENASNDSTSQYDIFTQHNNALSQQNIELIVQNNEYLRKNADLAEEINELRGN